MLRIAAAVLGFLVVTNAASAADITGLKQGEYACYGYRSQVMIGLGFKVLPGGHYIDLDNKNKGTFTVKEDKVMFHGGHLGGQTGHELKGGNFVMGAQVVCEPYE